MGQSVEFNGGMMGPQPLQCWVVEVTDIPAIPPECDTVFYLLSQP